MTRTLVIAMFVVTMIGRSAAADDAADEQAQWRTAFFGSLALTIGTGVFLGVSYVSIHSEAGEIEATKADGSSITQEDCNDRAGISGDEGAHFDSACEWRSRFRTASVFTIGFGVVTLATAYLAFRSRDEAPSSTAVTVTPTISRDGAGAQLQLRW